ncbi:MAG: dicarboxylate/amino acid:cation symporter [Saprospiraceae bacterium]|nr:dicarboxylate/amino acid:cation symporter [Saprospiraceae bacterium]
MKKLELHWQILIGMVLGVIFGIVASRTSWGPQFTEDWIKPVGTIFINLLKLIAIPLIIVSLAKGISDLQDIAQFSRMGGRTIGLYIVSTVIAITVGLLLVNIFQPGNTLGEETIAQLSGEFGQDATTRVESAIAQKDAGPLKFLVDIVPDNFFSAASDNTNMLQVIFVVIFFGISLLLIEKHLAEPIQRIITGLNEIVMKMVDIIMLLAPYAVFALLASLIAEYSNPDLLVALGYYGLTVIAGLALMIVIYIIGVFLITGKKPGYFLNGISPAQLLAFSTSSSAATLPVTMERVEEHLGVEGEVASFVCPVGATINMDGTSLYQAVAAVFICQALQFDLSLSGQLTIVLTATLASIGSAAVPGAGMVMLVIVLEAVGLPAEMLAIGLALIFAVDRPLDMMRTMVNVTGDATVSMIVAKSVNKLGLPHERKIDDYYHKETAVNND